MGLSVAIVLGLGLLQNLLVFLPQLQMHLILNQINMSSGIRVKFIGEFHRLQINKNIQFQSRIMWKRHNSKAQSALVTHSHGYSIFNETLTLEVKLIFNDQKGCYDDKNTEVVAIIMNEGKTRSGGYAKYNVAEIINQNLSGKVQKILLTQCPDPNANIEVTFTYEILSDTPSLFDEKSVLNNSSRDWNYERVDFHDDKLSSEMERINTTINKFNQLAVIVKARDKRNAQKMPELMTKLQISQGENASLKRRITKLEQNIKDQETDFKRISKEDKKQIVELEKLLDKKNKQIRSKELIQHDDESDKYRKLYEEVCKELQELKNPLRGSLGFGAMVVEDVEDFAHFRASEQDKERDNLGKKVEGLQMEKLELQSQVANLSYKLAQLFNASSEFGGAKLLDYLQTAIGLTEF